jgi:hypothetical protein
MISFNTKYMIGYYTKSVSNDLIKIKFSGFSRDKIASYSVDYVCQTENYDFLLMLLKVSMIKCK